MIIDADGHYVEPPDLWQEFLDPAYRDRVTVERTAEGHLRRVLLGDFPVMSYDHDEEQRAERPFGPGDFFTPGGLKSRASAGRPFEDSDPGGSDPQHRLKVHDENQMDAAVIFPTFGMAVPLIADQDFAEASCRAVNRWAHEYASVAPDELYMIASLPWQDPERAARELRRCVEDYGFVAGSIMPVPARDGRLISDPSLDVLWATAVELDVPMCVHAAARVDLDLTGYARLRTFLGRHAAVHPLEGMLAFAALYEGRVFDRFPQLRVGFMESSCGWAPFWLERLDEHAEIISWTFDPPLERMASDVFRDQCVIGCEGEEHMVPYVQSLFGEGCVLWASDYPHFDTEPPFAGDMLERTDLTDSQRAGVMWRAAVEFYKLDVDSIRRSHERRGT